MAKKPHAEVERIGFKVKKFDVLIDMLDFHIDELLAQKHGTSESGWINDINRLKIIATILKNDNSELSKILPPHDKDHIMTYACWEFVDNIYRYCKSTFTHKVINSTSWKTVSKWLGLFEYPSTIVKENAPTILQQRDMYAEYLSFFKHLVHVNGDSKNGFLDPSLLCFDPVDSTKFIARLTDRHAECEKKCDSGVLTETKNTQKRDQESLKEQEKSLKEPKSSFWMPNPFSFGASNTSKSPDEETYSSTP